MEKDDRILMEALKKFEKWTPTSKRMFEEAKNYIAGGVTGDVKFFEPYPVLMRKAHGSKIEDVDGNSYVDLLCAYGAIILGHGNTITRSAMKLSCCMRYSTVFMPAIMESGFPEKVPEWKNALPL